MSPIEHVWDMVARRLVHRVPPATTVDALWTRIQNAWREIPQEHIQVLFDSMPRRLGALITTSAKLRCLLWTVLVLGQLVAASKKCSSSGKPLKYLWGDALSDPLDCIGPNGDPYPAILRNLRFNCIGTVQHFPMPDVSVKACKHETGNMGSTTERLYDWQHVVRETRERRYDGEHVYRLFTGSAANLCEVEVLGRLRRVNTSVSESSFGTDVTSRVVRFPHPRFGEAVIHSLASECATNMKALGCRWSVYERRISKRSTLFLVCENYRRSPQASTFGSRARAALTRAHVRIYTSYASSDISVRLPILEVLTHVWKCERSGPVFVEMYCIAPGDRQPVAYKRSADCRSRRRYNSEECSRTAPIAWVRKVPLARISARDNSGLRTRFDVVKGERSDHHNTRKTIGRPPKVWAALNNEVLRTDERTPGAHAAKMVSLTQSVVAPFPYQRLVTNMRAGSPAIKPRKVRGRCGVMDRLLASHQGGSGSIPGGATPRPLTLGNRIGRCHWLVGPLGDPPLPRPRTPTPLDTHFARPTSALKTFKIPPLVFFWWRVVVSKVARTFRTSSLWGSQRTGRSSKTLEPHVVQQALLHNYQRSNMATDESLISRKAHEYGALFFGDIFWLCLHEAEEYLEVELEQDRRAARNNRERTILAGAKRAVSRSGSYADACPGRATRLCKTRYNTTAPMYGVSLTSGLPVAIVQKFPDLLQQVVFEYLCFFQYIFNSSGTIPTCENPGAAPPGIEPGLPQWEASSLTTKPPWPPHSAVEFNFKSLAGFPGDLPFLHPCIPAQFLNRLISPSSPLKICVHSRVKEVLKVSGMKMGNMKMGKVSGTMVSGIGDRSSSYPRVRGTGTNLPIAMLDLDDLELNP
ncbi:hypothetical protein PR048_012075 [Dryococelus australis]|uniref:Uncharacterized protein n=1 Tax=Dryococelus australis TaxID=614101 RepID=A0ABQ9HNB0_9NEOP|nr:hypothetical protein PR048_012075 [Dryococelus australis]